MNDRSEQHSHPGSKAGWVRGEGSWLGSPLAAKLGEGKGSDRSFIQAVDELTQSKALSMS